MKRSFYFLSVLFIIVIIPFLWGCDNGKETEPDIISEIKSELKFESNTESQTITFTTNKAWTATLSAPSSWCKISSSSGDPGLANLVVNVTENEEYNNRIAILNIKVGNVEKAVTITQRQTDAILAGDEYEIPENGGILEIGVIANVDVKVHIPSEIIWIRQQNTGTRGLSPGKIILEVDENDDIQERKAIITIQDGKNSVSSVITVCQPTRSSIRTVHVEEPWTLVKKIGPHYQDITELTLSGMIFISELEVVLSIPGLYYLNLSDVVLADGPADNPSIYSTVSSDWFSQNTKLKTIIIPNNVTEIGESAFSGCVGLTSVTIPNNVSLIRGSAFSDCTNLASIVIPDGVTSIAEKSFLRCTGLMSVTIPSSVTSIGELAFGECIRLTSIILPGSLKSIARYAFSTCISLTSVVIPNSVTSIGEGAFSHCNSLTSVAISNSVTNLESSIFSGCKSLTSVVIPNGVTAIGSDLFFGCTGLTAVHIPNSVTNIGWSAFSGCENLTSITIPDGVKVIRASTFHECKRLTSLTIPNSITSIEHAAFNYSGLTSITIPNSVTSIGHFAFNGCPHLTSVVILDGITNIEQSVFSNCPHLISVTLPNSLTNIGESAFLGCVSLTSITIPNSVTSIEWQAFHGCSALNSVFIGSGIKKIGENYEFATPFSFCNYIKEIHIKAAVPPIGYQGFHNEAISLYVPKGCKDAYQDSPYWKDFKEYIEE